MKPYYTVLTPGQAEQTIERSRFIGYVFPAKTVSECEDFFEQIRKEHRLATHNVAAYTLGEDCRQRWASDDGEPRGTSGAPIVQMLTQEEISDVAIVVTRYFGGIKLGTGGLMRAYTGTAKLALSAAERGLVSEKLVLDIETDYTGYNRLEAAASGIYTIGGAVFEEAVSLSLICEPEKEATCEGQIRTACPDVRILSKRIDTTTTPV